MSGHPPGASPNSAIRAEERVTAYELRLKGLTIRGVAARMGCSRSKVEALIREEIDARVIPVADEVRKFEVDRLDAWLSRLEERMDQGEDPVKLVSVAIKVSERRARLLGLDAPERADFTVHQVTAEDVALSQLISEAKARQATEEAELKGRQA